MLPPCVQVMRIPQITIVIDASPVLLPGEDPPSSPMDMPVSEEVPSPSSPNPKRLLLELRVVANDGEVVYERWRWMPDGFSYQRARTQSEDRDCHPPQKLQNEPRAWPEVP